MNVNYNQGLQCETGSDGRIRRDRVKSSGGGRCLVLCGGGVSLAVVTSSRVSELTVENALLDELFRLGSIADLLVEKILPSSGSALLSVRRREGGITDFCFASRSFCAA